MNVEIISLLLASNELTTEQRTQLELKYAELLRIKAANESAQAEKVGVYAKDRTNDAVELVGNAIGYTSRLVGGFFGGIGRKN